MNWLKLITNNDLPYILVLLYCKFVILVYVRVLFIAYNKSVTVDDKKYIQRDYILHDIIYIVTNTKSQYLLITNVK